MLIMNKWFKRLGNNINQISNIIDISIAYKHNIIFNVKHRFFDLSIIENYFSKYNNSESITDNKFNFFYKNKLPYSSEIYEQNIEERNKILKAAFLINNINKLPENDLVIHIRSGDIFSNSTPHPNFVPPPLSYYTKQIDKQKYQNIIIVCEDTVNPVVNKLLDLYKNSIYTENTLEEDIKLLLGATNVIFSVGTFVPALMRMSDNIKHLYGKPINNEELQDYYIIMKPWKNTKKQRDYILTYNYN
jgi:hypothetical protein